MIMLRAYKIFTISYSYLSPVVHRDAYGDRISVENGKKPEKELIQGEFRVIAKSESKALLWANERLKYVATDDLKLCVEGANIIDGFLMEITQ